MKTHFHVHTYTDTVFIHKYLANKKPSGKIECLSEPHVTILDSSSESLEVSLMSHEIPSHHYSRGIYYEQTPDMLELFNRYTAPGAVILEQPLMSVSGQFNRQMRLKTTPRENLDVCASLILQWLRIAKPTLVIAPHVWVLTVIHNFKKVLKIIKDKDDTFSISSEKHE